MAKRLLSAVLRRRLVVVLALAGSTLSVRAGEIRLVSDLWPMVCRVEVAEGIGAWEQATAVHEIGRVAPGTVHVGRDRLCYRRSSVPDDCYSDLNAWVCLTHLGDGLETMQLY